MILDFELQHRACLLKQQTFILLYVSKVLIYSTVMEQFVLMLIIKGNTEYKNTYAITDVSF